jgi:hypothetical protein
MARKEPRQAVSRAATILYGDKRVPCRMANVSRTGAKLRVKNPDWLPNGFEVLDTFSGKKRRAKIVWIEGENVGIRFHDAAPVVPDQIVLVFGRREA